MGKHGRYTSHHFHTSLVTEGKKKKKKKKTQDTELAVLDQTTSVSGVHVGDPFRLNNGIVPEEEIAGLRRRQRGKSVAKYQMRQNDVCDRAKLEFILINHLYRTS